ncbi:MAG: prenyltransferase/squalene oxidase repeat-containing protein [Planctomycetota bacterium]
MEQEKIERLAAILLLALAAPALPQDDFAKKVAKARDKAVAFLRTHQDEDGSWGQVVTGSFTWGTALNLYALASAGVPADDPAIRRGVRFLELNPEAVEYGAHNGVQAAAMVVLALSRIDEERHRDRIRMLTERLVRSQKDPGFWDYPLGRFSMKDGKPSAVVRTGRGYGSHTMVAVHALLEGGAEVPGRTWKRVRRYYKDKQSGTGGWRQFSSLRRDGPMLTAAGIVGYLSAGGEADSRVMRRGLKALDDVRIRMARTCHPRYAFAVVRTARAASLPRADWDTPVARSILREQRRDGGWGIQGRHGVISHSGKTAYALLTLAYAR